jgi:hypothetical protein
VAGEWRCLLRLGRADVDERMPWGTVSCWTGRAEQEWCSGVMEHTLAHPSDGGVEDTQEGI